MMPILSSNVTLSSVWTRKVNNVKHLLKLTKKLASNRTRWLWNCSLWSLPADSRTKGLSVILLGGFWSPLLFLKLYSLILLVFFYPSAYFFSFIFPSSSRFCSLSWSWFSFQRVCYAKVQLLLRICDRNPLCCLRLAYGPCWELTKQLWSYERYCHTRHSWYTCDRWWTLIMWLFILFFCSMPCKLVNEH